MKAFLAIPGFGTAACLLAALLSTQGRPGVPTVDAGAGPCSAAFVVEDGDRKPLYSARIDLIFRYGFWNLHRTTLEAFTDSNGRARFEGLPRRVKKLLVFQVRYNDRQKSVTDNPLATCQADYKVVLP